MAFMQCCCKTWCGLYWKPSTSWTNTTSIFSSMFNYDWHFLEFRSVKESSFMPSRVSPCHWPLSPVPLTKQWHFLNHPFLPPCSSTRSCLHAVFPSVQCAVMEHRCGAVAWQLGLIQTNFSPSLPQNLFIEYHRAAKQSTHLHNYGKGSPRPMGNLISRPPVTGARCSCPHTHTHTHEVGYTLPLLLGDSNYTWRAVPSPTMLPERPSSHHLHSLCISLQLHWEAFTITMDLAKGTYSL